MSSEPVPVCPTLWQRFGPQFIRFFVVGVGATVVQWVVYVALNAIFSVSEQDSFACMVTLTTGYIVSFIGNYIVSLRWTFKTKGSGKKGLGFALSHAINMGMQNALQYIFLRVGVGAWMSAIVSMLLPWLAETSPRLVDPTTLVFIPICCIIVPINFLLVRFFLTRD